MTWHHHPPRWAAVENVVAADAWPERALLHASQALHRAHVGLTYAQWIGRERPAGRRWASSPPGPHGPPSPVGQLRKQWGMSRERPPEYAWRH